MPTPSSRASRRAEGAAGIDAPASADAPLVDDEDDLADLHLLAGLHLRFLDDARDGRGNLDRRLVGFELEDRLVLLDGIARVDEHAEDVAALDVLAQLGEFHVCRHS
jgi:hypothetical protein